MKLHGCIFASMNSIYKTGWFITGLCVFTSLQAGIVWDHTEVEYKAKAGEEIVSASFPFTVVDTPITIQSIRTSCGCTTTRLDRKTYQPGETGIIEANFELGSRVGQQQKYISIQTDDPQSPKQDLLMSVYIPYILKVEPRFVYWDKGLTTYHEQVIELVPDTEVELTIESVSCDQDQLQLRLEHVQGEDKYRIHLQPVVPEGEVPFFRAIIKIVISSPVELKQSVFHAYAFMKSS